MKRRRRHGTLELKVIRIGNGKLTWDETYRACARERENWKDLEATLADGLD